jgi:hypothetical protein
MTNLEKLQSACKLGNLDQAKEFVSKAKKEDLEGDWNTIYDYCSTVELVKLFEERQIIPIYKDILSIINDDSKVEVFDYLINKYDFTNMEKSNDEEYDFEIALENMPNSPLIFLAIKKAFAKANKAYIDKYINEFKSIDWNSKVFTDQWGEDNYNVIDTAVDFVRGEDDYAKDRTNKSIQWLNVLIDEYNIYNFSIMKDLIIFRQKELIKKYIKKDPKEFLKCQKILENMAYHKSTSEEYEYKNDKENKHYRLTDKPEIRDEILYLLLDSGYNFIQKETQTFKELLTGKINLKFPQYNYGKYSYDKLFEIKFDHKIFWEILEKHPNKSDEQIALFSIELDYEQIERLEKLNYLSSLEEVLCELIENFEQDQNYQKAEKLVKKGVKLSIEQQTKLILKSTYDSQSSKNINKFICENLANEDTAKQLLETIKTKKAFDLENIFKSYVEIKKPLFKYIENEILGLENAKELYAKYYLQTSDEIYNYLNTKKEYYTTPQKNYHDKMEMVYIGDFRNFGYELLESQNYDGLKGVIKFVEENSLSFYNPTKENYLDQIVKMVWNDAPSYVVEYLFSKINKYKFQYSNYSIDKKFIEKLIEHEMYDFAQKLKSKKIDLNIGDKYDKIPLHYACESRDIDKIQKYIKIGLSLNSYDRYGKTCIDAFVKSKPDPKDSDTLEFFKELLEQFVKDGGNIKTIAITPIKAKKYAPYHQILEDMTDYVAPQDETKELEEDEELVEVVFYKTEKSVHYHKYTATAMVPKKDLVLDDTDLINDYVQSWEYERDWDSQEDTEYEVKK